MKDFEYQDELSFLLRAEDLITFNRLIDGGDFAFQDGQMTQAEQLYKSAIRFSEVAWGPYHWTEANALLALHCLLTAQGRTSEAEVAYALCRKILTKY